MSLQKSPSIGSLTPPNGKAEGNGKRLTKSTSIVSLSKLWMIHVELLSGHNLAVRDRSGVVHTCMQYMCYGFKCLDVNK